MNCGKQIGQHTARATVPTLDLLVDSVILYRSRSLFYTPYSRARSTKIALN